MLSGFTFNYSPQPYNPDYDPMPPAMVSYGQPSYQTRVVCLMRALGLSEAADAFQDEMDRLLEVGPIYDARDVVAEFTHPEDPHKVMAYRLKTDAEIEVDIIMMAQQYLPQPNNGWLDLGKYIPEDKLTSIYAFEREQQATMERRLKRFGIQPHRW